MPAMYCHAGMWAHCCQVFCSLESSSRSAFLEKISQVLNIVNLFEFFKTLCEPIVSWPNRTSLWAEFGNSQWVLELTLSSLWELIMTIFSQVYKLWLRISALKSAMVVVFIPQKLASATNLGSPPPILPRHCQRYLLRPLQFETCILCYSPVACLFQNFLNPVIWFS